MPESREKPALRNVKANPVSSVRASGTKRILRPGLVLSDVEQGLRLPGGENLTSNAARQALHLSRPSSHDAIVDFILSH